MSEFTKGPWRCALMTPFQETALVKAERGTVAWVHADDTAEVEGRIVEVLSSEFKANARLISAAPDLLESLEALVLLGVADPKLAEHWGPLFRAGQAAIKKARGGE